MSPVGHPPRPLRTPATLLLALVAAAAIVAPAAAQQTDRPTPGEHARQEIEIRWAEPPAPIGEMLRRDPNFATLDAPSPDGRYFMVPSGTQLSTLELMSRPTYRLAELELRPATDRLWHLDTYGINGLRIFDLETRAFREVQLPANSFISDLVWSPDSRRIAFLAHLPNGTEVWTADAATGRAQRFSSTRIMATLGTSAAIGINVNISTSPSRMLQWTPDGSLITLAVPANRGAEPRRDPVPAGPQMRQTRPEAAPGRTLPNLLRDAHDVRLFQHYTRSQLVELMPGGRARTIGEPRMYRSLSLSPDGRSIIADFAEGQLSLIVSHPAFPGRTVILDRASGNELLALASRPLREGGGGDGGPAASLRGAGWLPDGSGLTYLRRAGGEDQIMRVAAPFDTATATVLASSADGLSNVRFSRDVTRAFATVTRGGRTHVVHWDLREEQPQRRTLVDFAPDSLFARPGELWTQQGANGVSWVMVSSGDDAVYLTGDGLRPDLRPQPFVDRVALADGSRTRLFEGERTSWDRPRVALDPDLRRMIVTREARDVFPDSYLWTPDGALVNLTRNRDPFPEFTAARRVDFTFNRRDGLEVHGRISLPLNYRDGDRVPALFWTYPREFTTPEGYTRSTWTGRNLNEYSHVTYLRWSDFWLTQGYALVAPDIPIIGENYNDTYISNMVDAMYAAMRAVDGLGFVDMDRIGHGGHSYGAFATANLLAHTPFFRAGIAGSGAYNRTLTPFGFQAERRNFWSAPHTYLDISPFMAADQINTPILFYHGADDNNSGTWPMQSQRLMDAMIALGKEAVLYMYPYESHTPRAVETKMDMWARMIDWFDRHVKAPPGAVTANGSR
jgi:dipeptidyl aminopeptidase/acylaminoacyl peptidase